MTAGDKGIPGKVSLRHLKPGAARRWPGSNRPGAGGGQHVKGKQKVPECREGAAKVKEWGVGTGRGWLCGGGLQLHKKYSRSSE